MPNDKIKLLKMVTCFKIGGTERQVTNLALRIDPKRFDLHLACIIRTGELLDELRELDVPCPEFGISRLYGFHTWAQQVRVAAYIRKHHIHIVHTYGFYSNVFAVPAAKIAGVKVIASIRDTCAILTPWQRRVQKQVCRLADYVLVNARAIRQALLDQGYRADNIGIIPNGIVPAIAAQKDAPAIRTELGLPPDSRIVLVSSRLNRMKGVSYFLDAAARVAARVPNVYFVIAGDGADRQSLEAEARELGISNRAVFAGFRTDIPALLEQSSLSVLPSLSEGLSNSLLESMAAGVPTVAADVGGNPEAVQDGVTGFLVPPANPIALAEAMLRLLEDRELASRFGAAGRRRVAECFSIETSVRRTEQVYEWLAASGRTGRSRLHAQPAFANVAESIAQDTRSLGHLPHLQESK